MKGILFFILSVCLAFLTGFLTTAYAITEQNYTVHTLNPVLSQPVVYGLIGENVILFDGELLPLTTLPATYFVQITDETEEYYAVKYNDLSGFVQKIRVFIIDYEPKIKFASGFFTAKNDTHSVLIRSAPHSDFAAIGEILDNEKVYYYGSITGEALVPAAGNVWYYVRFSTNPNKYGYVYSTQGSIDPFPVNPGDKMPTEKNSDDTALKKEGLPDWVFIIILCVPAVVIMLALFGRTKKQPIDTEKQYSDTV